MIAIYKRELKSYFHTVIGWLFIAVTIALMGVYFMAINLTYGYSNLAYMISSVAFLFIITIPILSMKTLAEERKTKTDQLILTVPVSVTKIVLGKYLAMVSILLIVVAVVSFLTFELKFIWKCALWGILYCDFRIFSVWSSLYGSRVIHFFYYRKSGNCSGIKYTYIFYDLFNEWYLRIDFFHRKYFNKTVECI